MSTLKPTLALSSQVRSALRAAAHSLRPVVLIGDQGLTPAVLKEIEVALTAHELIKIRVNGQERADRDAMMLTIAEQLDCSPVHHLGKTLIVYRQGKKAAYLEQTGAIDPTVKRKPTEPHTPKKMAALGKKVTKRPRPNAKSVDSAEPSAIKAFSAEKSARPAKRRSIRDNASGARSSRKSALSLRAGARRRTT
ncbi:MAG: YhbY family RNA-binding protein [Orrella sp.]